MQYQLTYQLNFRSKNLNNNKCDLSDAMDELD